MKEVGEKYTYIHTMYTGITHIQILEMYLRGIDLNHCWSNTVSNVCYLSVSTEVAVNIHYMS